MTTNLPTLVIEFATETPNTVRTLVWSDDRLKGESRSLALAHVASLVDKSEFYYIGLPPTQLQQFGQTLYRWLDGDERRLSAALE